MKVLALVALLIIGAGPSRAALELPRVSMPLIKATPTVDGAIGEDEWAGAVRSIGLNSQYDMKLAAREVIFWVGADKSNLYLALKMELPPTGDLLTRAVPDGDRDITAALHDDTIELVVNPHLGMTTGDRRYFHIIVNERGAMFDRSFDPGNAQNPMTTAWRLKNWQFRNRRAEGWWEVEIAIPFAEIGATEADLAHPWGLRVCRNWQRGWDQSRWEGVTAAYEDVPTMPQVRFDEAAPVVQVVRLRGDAKPEIEVSVANGGPAEARPLQRPIPVKVFLSDTWSRNPPTEMTKELTIAPGTKESVTLTPPHGGPEGDHHTIIRVTSPDGAKTYYLRDFVWKFERPTERWTMLKEDKQAIQLQYAVYPYYRKLKVRVGIESLASKDKVTGATVTFGAEETLVTGDLRFKDYVVERVLDLPELAAGNYVVAVKLQGEGVPTEAVTGLYERVVFPWEWNELGMSQRVIPPFTPIEVEGRGRIVRTVLREHRLNEDGLWDQVVSLGKPLLREPMRWVAYRGDKRLAVEPDMLRQLPGTPDQRNLAAEFFIDRVNIMMRIEWEQDGMAKYIVYMPAERDKQLDRLSLEIPLDDAQMKYMHACGDGLRFNYAGLAPAGEGVVWDSAKANRNDIVGTFYPYVWLGGGERGLAFFADSDRGYSLDDKTPMIELVRQAGVLTMRVNFITKPTKLDQARTLEFGLQATPVKPMPEDPVSWRRWLCSRVDERVKPFTILGSTFYYGAESYNFSPLDQDLSIYTAFSQARDSGQFNAEFVKQWLEKYRRFTEPGSDRWKFYDAHINAGMRTASGTKREDGWLLTPYTNPRGMGFDQPEWPSFQDEWLQSAYAQRAKSGAVSYDVCPVRSFQDAALWHYQEMMTVFDGIYWDNLYLSSNFNTIAGGAWTDEAGKVHPSMGLWAMRDLVKRTAFLFNEEGRPVFSNVIHMTNACLVPIMAFANINLDWEWQYGNRDFQDRFTPELTVAETIGRQCGNIPLILSGGMKPENDAQKAWLQRTRTGVCLVHEIRVWDWQPKEMYDLYRKLFDFGYGEKDCRVYNYWDEGFPLRIEGVSAKGIVLVRGGQALAIVTDYGEGGECRLQLDMAALKLTGMSKAMDVETGEAITCAAPGEATFALKKHDYRAVVWE
jgi:hypothetical protein